MTIHDVAEEAGVSVATVSHVINDTRYVSPELTKNVEDAMEKLGYRRNSVARSLKTQKTHTIGLIVSDISNPFFSELLRGVENVSTAESYSLIISNTDETIEKEELYLDVLQQKQVDGFIIAPTGKTDGKLKGLFNRDIPFVFVDRKIDNIAAPSVLSKNIAGSKKATSHLIEKDHTKIGVVSGLESVTTTRERIKGYKESLSQHGISFNTCLVEKGNSQVQGGYEAAINLLEKDNSPTAIFSTNNLMTIGAMRAIKSKGIECPEEVALVGFDDFEWADIFEPTLTTVAQNPRKIGAKAANILFSLINGKQDFDSEVRIATDLIIRDST